MTYKGTIEVTPGVIRKEKVIYEQTTGLGKPKLNGEVIKVAEVYTKREEIQKVKVSRGFFRNGKVKIKKGSNLGRRVRQAVKDIVDGPDGVTGELTKGTINTANAAKEKYQGARTGYKKATKGTWLKRLTPIALRKPTTVKGTAYEVTPEGLTEIIDGEE